MPCKLHDNAPAADSAAPGPQIRHSWRPGGHAADVNFCRARAWRAVHGSPSFSLLEIKHWQVLDTLIVMLLALYFQDCLTCSQYMSSDRAGLGDAGFGV